MVATAPRPTRPVDATAIREAATSRTKAQTLAVRSPAATATRCGSPRTPVARSSRRSTSTLAKWAPRPSVAAAPISQPDVRALATAAANSGIGPKPTRYATPDHTVAFNPALYAHPA